MQSRQRQQKILVSWFAGFLEITAKLAIEKTDNLLPVLYWIVLHQVHVRSSIDQPKRFRCPNQFWWNDSEMKLRTLGRDARQ